MSYYIVCKEISSIRKECGSCRAIAEGAVACKRTEKRKRMKTEKQMLIIKGEIKTAEVRSCRYNAVSNKMEVEFGNGKLYSYAASNVEWLSEPQVLNPALYQISREGQEFFDIEDIRVFQGKQERYWHIRFGNGSEKDYPESELKIAKSCFCSEQAVNVFEYIKQIAGLSNLRNEETGEKILVKRFKKLSFVGGDTVLAMYLNPSLLQQNGGVCNYIPIFPFGCNNSQYKAVRGAMENRISVIQGPPGTGKTQTILNIIANILMQGKTVQIVSNNNAATENVYEKLSSPKYNLGFLVAALGSSKNKKIFLEAQNAAYPDFADWKVQDGSDELLQAVKEKSVQLQAVYDRQEELAALRQEQAALATELEYFLEYSRETGVQTADVKTGKECSAEQWMSLWQECQMIAEKRRRAGFWFRMKVYLQCRISDKSFYRQEIAGIITTFQLLYYRARERELAEKIREAESCLESVDKRLSDDLCKNSMILLRDRLSAKYGERAKRQIFEEEDLWKNSSAVLEEYPVILSTTFSSRNSLNPEVMYDYLIMDEASQVDIATGSLALSCAKNVVIVGDTKQLPNVVTEDVRGRADAIFDSFEIDEGYRYTKSFLQSVLDVMPKVKQTLLREHYRCHPKIINFCNQKFYRGELIIMTEDKGEKDVLSVVKTAPGNHVRNHYSQRQIDVIREEIVPRYVTDAAETGIIAPYKNQVEALEREFQDIDAATVHKFQGKEKDMIIISTVDDEITDFADDPYLINVAVSRAKKKLMLVVTGNRQARERNITDLISYIEYNNFEVAESRVYSVFDYLYKQYDQKRRAFLQRHRKVSEYDSENLMYSLIREILSADRFACFDVLCFFPMNKVIRNFDLLSERECQYIRNPATHLYFLIYNRISKHPVMAVEVDGYEYHKSDSVQASRDLLKNHIMELYEIPLLRFQTNGSGEKEKIIKGLDEVLGSG